MQKEKKKKDFKMKNDEAVLLGTLMARLWKYKRNRCNATTWTSGRVVAPTLGTAGQIKPVCCIVVKIKK